MMSEQKFDLLIIGAGPGGYLAAGRAGAKGKSLVHLGASLWPVSPRYQTPIWERNCPANSDLPSITMAKDTTQ